MIIAKVRKPFNTILYFLPYRGFTWYTDVALEGYVQPVEYDSDFDFSDVNQVKADLGAWFVDNIEYQQAVSLAAAEAIEESWFFDVGSQRLYVHVNHEKRMDTSDYDSLQIKGYSTDSVFYDENNICYEPRLNTIPSFSDHVDRFVFQKLKLISNTLTFDNTDDDFDFSFTSPVPGADVNLFFISNDDILAGKKALTPIYTGYAGSEKIETDRYSLRVEDKRGQLNKKIPNTYFDSTTYPDMESKFIGDLIPEGYGALSGLPAICTNGDLTAGDVTFQYATDGTGLTTVYVLIDEVWTAKTPTSSDALNCTFTLSAADGRQSSGRYRAAKVDCSLREQENPADILADMITRYLGFPFTGDYYNLADWGDERALLQDIAIVFDKRDEIFKWIEKIQNGSNLPFRFDIDPSGKYTIKVDDITRAVKKTYDYLDNINDLRTVDTDFTQYATDVLINYNKDQESGKYESLTRDTFKEETLDIYRLDKEIPLDTLLTSQADAEERGDNSLKDYKLARRLHKVDLPGILPAPLLDVIIFDSSVYISGVKQREYAGNVKIKFASYSYDFVKERTILTGYDINDIVSKGTSVFTQGAMYGDDMYGLNSTYYAPTTTFEQEAG